MLDSKKLSERLAHQLAQARQNKIDRLKSKLTQGAYRLNSSAIAKALVK